jgi:hypothetical protein
MLKIKNNKIISLKLPNIKKIGNYFLYNSNSLKRDSGIIPLFAHL